MGKGIAVTVLLLLLVAVVMLPSILFYRESPSRDSGVALYAGWRILNGDILYRDIWDHKSPALHYFNAVGLLIARGSVWGVVAIEFLFILCAAVLSFVLMRELFGNASALFATTVWLISLILVHEGGNLTEEYGLPFQFFALYLFVRSEKKGWYPWRGLLIGLTFGITFLLRQNLTGIGVAIILWIVWGGNLSGIRPVVRNALASILVGFSAMVATVAVYFAAHSALGDFMDAILRYNFAYSTTSIENRFMAIADGFRILLKSGIALTAIFGWMCGCAYLRHGEDVDRARRGLVQLILIAFPIELALACVSGRSYPHYYMAWLPVFAVLTGFFAYGFTSGHPLRASGREGGGEHNARERNYLLAALLVAMSAIPLGMLFRQMGALKNSPAACTKRAAVEYITRFTKPDDPVLIWGAEPSVNFLAHRRSPSKYFFQYPLYTRGYQRAGLVRRFLDDLLSNEPALIIDTSPTNALIPPIDPAKRREWVSPRQSYGVLPEMGALFEFIAGRYRPCGIIMPGRWAVYTRRSDAGDGV